MRIQIDKKRINLFLKLGLAYLLLWLFMDLVKNPQTFLSKIVNNIWLITFLTAVNFILFEYTIPFVKLNWKRLLATPFLLFIHLMLFSFGLYAWRHIGISIGIYTELKKTCFDIARCRISCVIWNAVDFLFRHHSLYA